MKSIIKGCLCFSIIFLIGCGGDSDDPAPTSCDNLPIVEVVSTSATSTCAATDGEIVLSGSGGAEPYEFSVDGGSSFQVSGDFLTLAAGTYTVLTKDSNGCISDEKQATVEASGSTLAASATATADTECVDNNGTIEVNVTGGEPPYQYDIGKGFVSNNSFVDLPPASYEVIIKDATGCAVSTTASVAKGDTGTSYQNQVKSIITANCAVSGCHNGDNGASRDWTNFERLQAAASQIKSRTQNGSMPPNGSLSEAEKTLIACWVDEGAKNN
ncbi:hypothetical protein E1176_18615 [Fulvivirga sp. RKSG066]|uniref:SprB repeat-containing protein n=1 Tax=Fulvivirga aurantia TaxID=2529383 RepID=UPI0012BB65E5|nr:SprB repeat-containing protein [Fulvivirga aurantia]MTI23050.1 hypothetical protein [Fulvivirga aurantia]